MMEQKVDMYSLVEEWKTSGMKKGDFAALKSVSYHSFNYWLKKYNKEHSSGESDTAVSFFSVSDNVANNKKVHSIKPSNNKTVCIELPGGVKISIY